MFLATASPCDHGAMAKRGTGKVAILFLFLALTSCAERYTEIEDIGALRLTKHMSRDRLRWEGGTTHLRKSTLCSQISGSCLEDWSFTLEKPGNDNPRWIAVTRLKWTANYEYQRKFKKLN